MKQALKKFELIKEYYLYIFFIGLVIRAVNIYSLLPPTFDSIFFKLIGIIGVVLLLIDFIMKFTQKKLTYNVFLILYILVLILTSLLHRQYGLGENLKTIMWATLQYFVIYQFAFENPKKQSFFNRISYGFIYSWFILVSMSMVLFFCKFGYERYYDARHRIRIGFLESRLFGVFSDVNNAAIASLVVIILVLFYLFSTKVKGFNKFIFWINIPLQFFFIVLSGSRSAYIISLIIIAIFTFIYTIKKGEENHKIKSFIISAVATVGSVIAVVVLFNITKTFFQGLLPHLNEFNPFKHTETAKTIENNTISSGNGVDNTLARKDVVENKDFSNARISIWKSAWEIFKTNWIIGVSPKNIVPYAQAILPNTYIAKAEIAVHNAYLNVLTSTGVLGMIPFMVFLIKSTVENLKKIIYSKVIGKDYHFIYCLILLSYALYACLNNELVYENTVGTFIFWLFLGRINSKNGEH